MLRWGDGMHMVDLILKKRRGETHNLDELRYIINEYVAGRIPDYQVSAWLMAVYFQGMTHEETANLTLVMAESGEQIDLSAIPGITVDKHSTGGVGDKTTFIIASLVAACGVPVPKMSGRGLGHTGGTIDKLESIPQVKVALTREEFLRIVKDIGLAVTGQSAALAPADKLLYALRDVTGTVDSIPLIGSSVMSKKLAAGSQAILLDVKVGSGAFMKSLDDALELAKTMVAIGVQHNRQVVALVTDMDRPLGHAIGNALEMAEVVATLQNKGPQDLTEESLVLAANMLFLGGRGSYEECESLARQALTNGRGYKKFLDFVKAQGGQALALENRDFAKAKYRLPLRSTQAGYITQMDAQRCGEAALALGAGRHKKGDAIDYKAGIEILKKTGDMVNCGDVLGYVQSDREELLSRGAQLLESAFTMGPEAPKIGPLILAKVTKEGVERYD